MINPFQHGHLSILYLVHFPAYHAMDTYLNLFCVSYIENDQFSYQCVQMKTFTPICHLYKLVKHPFCPLFVISRQWGVRYSILSFLHDLVLISGISFGPLPFVWFCNQQFLARCLCKERHFSIFQALSSHIPTLESVVM